MTATRVSTFIDKYQNVLVWILRIVLGAVFVMSGLTKAIDVWGTVFKIEEYVSVWHIAMPRSLIVVVSLVLSGAEFILGLMLMLGAYKRSAVWLLLLQMAVMLPLTAYIWIKNPVSDCGCFGDFLKISNAATFWKNVVITAGLVFLARRNRNVGGVYHAYSQWLVATFSAIYILIVSLYGFNIQPLIDFRSFAPGSSIAWEQNEDQNEEFEFVYEKDGEQRNFTIDQLPDSTWTFVSRVQTKGQKTTDVSELVVYDADGENVTDEAIATEGDQLIIVIPQPERASISATYSINELQRYMEDKDGSVIELIATDGDRLEAWKEKSMASLPIYLAEETTLKELARGDISAVYVRDGIILWKRTLPTVDVDLVTSGQISLDDYSTDGSMTLLVLSLMLLFALVFVYIIDASSKFIAWREKKRKRKESKSK